MPNWRLYIIELVNPTQTNWRSVSDLQTDAKNKYKASVQAINPVVAAANRTWPKPSVPMIQGMLIGMLQARTVVAKKGAYGAAYFANMAAYRAGGVSRYSLIEPREYRLRGVCRDFNRTVDEAIRDNTPLPNPWNSRAPNSTAVRDPNAPAPSQIFDGPLSVPEETLNMVTQLLEVRNTRNWTDTMTHFIRNVEGPIREIFEYNFPQELRALIDTTDIRDILLAAREALIVKARERRTNAPKNLEEDYYDRLRAKGETID